MEPQDPPAGRPLEDELARLLAQEHDAEPTARFRDGGEAAREEAAAAIDALILAGLVSP